MERLFGAIPEVLKGLGADPGASDALVFAAWRQCAGPLIVDRTEPLEYFESRLVIAVSDATWRAHLEDLSPQIVARLNAALGRGSVKFIEFRIHPEAFRRTRAKRARGLKREPSEISDSLKEAAAQISDEKLRTSFLGAAAAYLTKK